jgi:hypothetical protein
MVRCSHEEVELIRENWTASTSSTRRAAPARSSLRPEPDAAQSAAAAASVSAMTCWRRVGEEFGLVDRHGGGDATGRVEPARHQAQLEIVVNADRVVVASHAFGAVAELIAPEVRNRVADEFGPVHYAAGDAGRRPKRGDHHTATSPSE